MDFYLSSKNRLDLGTDITDISSIITPVAPFKVNLLQSTTDRKGIVLVNLLSSDPTWLCD